MACPKCGGNEREALAPGYWRCNSQVIASVTPPGTLQNPGQRPAPVLGTCGHEYQEGTPAGPAICSCGTYAIGKCLECNQPKCGFHSFLKGSHRVCVQCEGKRNAERIATNQRNKRNAAQRKLELARENREQDAVALSQLEERIKALLESGTQIDFPFTTTTVIAERPVSPGIPVDPELRAANLSLMGAMPDRSAHKKERKIEYRRESQPSVGRFEDWIRTPGLRTDGHDWVYALCIFEGWEFDLENLREKGARVRIWLAEDGRCFLPSMRPTTNSEREGVPRMKLQPDAKPSEDLFHLAKIGRISATQVTKRIDTYLEGSAFQL